MCYYVNEHISALQAEVNFVTQFVTQFCSQRFMLFDTRGAAVDKVSLMQI